MAGRIILDLPNPALDISGAIDPFSTLTFYENGTATLQAVYTDPTLTTAHPNPLGCDAAGRFPEVWAPNSTAYSVTWSFHVDPPITFDNIVPFAGTGSFVFASNYATLADADAAAGSSGVVILDPPAVFTLSSPITLVAARYVAWGGTIARYGNAVTFSHAPPPQEDVVVFDAGGTGAVTFAGRAGVVYASTFGAVGDGVSSYGNAMQQAHDCVKTFPDGGTLVTPDGTTIIDIPLVFDCTAGVMSATKSFKLQGKSGNSVLASAVSGAPMLFFGNAAAAAAFNITVQDLLLTSTIPPSSVTAGETWLAQFNNCQDAHLMNVNCEGGYSGQISVEKQQGFRFVNGRLAGYNVGAYGTAIGLQLSPTSSSTTQKSGQDSYFENITVRDFRTATHSGIGVQLLAVTGAAGSEHRFVACEIENCDLLVDVNENSVSFVSGSTETRGAFVTLTGSSSAGGTFTLTPAATGALYSSTTALMVPPPSGANIVSTPPSIYSGPPAYVVTMTSATMFNVTDPLGVVSPVLGTVGASYTGNLQFKITGTPAMGDSWTLTAIPDGAFRVGSFGTPVSFFRALDMNMSMSGLTNGLYFDFQNYKQFQVLDSDFDVVTGYAIAIASGAPSTAGLRSHIIGNRNLDPIVSAIYDNSGFDGRVKIEDNTVSGDSMPEYITLPVNAATPYTANAKTVVTANTADTTITDFLGGFAGKEMMVVINDGTSGTPSHTLMYNAGSGNNIFLRSGSTSSSQTRFNNGDILKFRASQKGTASSGVFWYQEPLASGTSPKYGSRVTTTTSSFTLTPGTDVQVQLLGAAAALLRTITPSTASAVDGETRFEIVCQTNHVAGHGWNVCNSVGTPLKTLSGAGQAAIIVYSAALGDYVLLEYLPSQKPGTHVVTADAAFSLTPNTDVQTQVLNVSATANRNISPSTTGAVDGETRFEIICLVAPAAGKQWNVNNASAGLLKALTGAGQSAIIVYSSTIGDYVLLE